MRARSPCCRPDRACGAPKRRTGARNSWPPWRAMCSSASGHSEAIITRDLTAARRFEDEVDAAAIYVNASTQFTDGGEFGLGAEIGISTQKLHARGPMGLEA